MSLVNETLSAALPAAILTGFSQTSRLLKLTTTLGADILVAECVRGEETIGQGFSFKIAALSSDAALSLKSLIGQPALLELLTSASRDQLRPFHGHVTAVEMAGADGAMARYNLTLEPWTAFLAHGRDSRIFQDMTVFDILDAVFNRYQAQGKLTPAWRFEVIDREAYPARSITTQYQESDLAFASRLMLEEGLFYFFEHSGDAGSPALGAHTMVIADHNGAFKPNAQASIAFSQPGATMRQDTLDRWRTEVRLQTNAIELSSWDYRSLDSRPVGAASAGSAAQGALVSRDVPGAYAYQSRAQGQRIADHQMQALEACKEIHVGAGTVRTLAPGTTFALTGHARYGVGGGADEGEFLVTRVVHLMHNNVSADLRAGLMQRLGQGALDILIGQEAQGSLHAAGKAAGERAPYRTRIDAIRSNLPYRSSGTDAHGRLLHPRPTVQGQQTAIVVGPPGAPIHTDRDHRVKVQFHWQRGAQSHSRLQHPAPDGHTGAPADDQAGTWVRVATPMAPVAGANWGSSTLPRVGQEVLIDFLEGNIDRPVVIGAVYNGRGQADAQHNQVGAGAGVATGNAPAWFPGESGGHAHPAALSGIKTQALQASQGGSGAYNQLLFDDSPGQSRLALQRHATAHHGTAELNLGHLLHQSDNQRLQPAGFGAELKSEHSVALRAGKGVLLATDARGSAVGAQMDSGEAVDQIGERVQMLTDLTELAHKHQAKLRGEAASAELPSIRHLADVGEAFAGTDGGAGGQDEARKASAYTAPHVLLSSPDGIVATTPADAVFGANETTTLAAGHDINLLAQGNHFSAVLGGIGLFSYGKASAGDKPNQETGIRLHAASGKVSAQSQSDATRITADKTVTVASTTASVVSAAKTYLALTAQGASLRLEGGNITLSGPGAITFKASVKELTGPASTAAPAIALPAKGEVQLCGMKAAGAAAAGDSMVPVN